MTRPSAHTLRERSNQTFEARHLKSGAKTKNHSPSRSTSAASSSGNIATNESRSLNASLMIMGKLNDIWLKDLIELIYFSNLVPIPFLSNWGATLVLGLAWSFKAWQSANIENLPRSYFPFNPKLSPDFMERFDKACLSGDDLTPLLQEVSDVEKKYISFKFSIMALLFQILNSSAQREYTKIFIVIAVLYPRLVYRLQCAGTPSAIERYSREAKEKLNVMTSCANIKWDFQVNATASIFADHKSMYTCIIPEIVEIEYQSKKFLLARNLFVNELKYFLEKDGVEKVDGFNGATGYELQVQIAWKNKSLRLDQEKFAARLHRAHQLNGLVEKRQNWLQELVNVYTGAQWEKSHLPGDLNVLPDWTLSLHASRLPEEFREILLKGLRKIGGDDAVSYNDETQMLKIHSIFAFRLPEDNAYKTLETLLKDYIRNHPVLPLACPVEEKNLKLEVSRERSRTESVDSAGSVAKERWWNRSVNYASGLVSSWFKRASIIAQVQSQPTVVKWPDGNSYEVYDSKIAPHAKVFHTQSPGGANYYFYIKLTPEEFGGGEEEYKSFVNTLVRGHFGGDEGEKGIVISGKACKLKIPNKDARVTGHRVGNGNFFELTSVENHNQLHRKKGFGK